MHIHIEQHIMALVVTNAVEADRVDIGRILQWLAANVKSQTPKLGIFPIRRATLQLRLAQS